MMEESCANAQEPHIEMHPAPSRADHGQPGRLLGLCQQHRQSPGRCCRDSWSYGADQTPGAW